MTGTTRGKKTRAGKASSDKRAHAELASASANPVLTALAERFPLWKRPGYLIRRLHQIHYAIFFEECADFGITPVQYGLLTVLSTNPNSDQVALAHLVGIDRTNVADVLRRLERRGLISRTTAPTDRRMLLACLTREGERLVEAMHPAMARAQERLLEALGKRERETFVMTLMLLLESNNNLARAPLGRARDGN